jgi:hypothetical protein
MLDVMTVCVVGLGAALIAPNVHKRFGLASFADEISWSRIKVDKRACSRG